MWLVESNTCTVLVVEYVFFSVILGLHTATEWEHLGGEDVSVDFASPHFIPYEIDDIYAMLLFIPANVGW